MRITKNPEERKKEIEDTALKLFSEKGIQKTSMNDIAKEMDVAKGLIYYYFPSKEALIERILETFTEAVDEALKIIMAESRMDFYEKLGAVISLFFTSIMEHPALTEITPGNSGIFQYLRGRLSEIAILHAGVLLEEGKKAGYISVRRPEYMLKILIGGIADLYVEGVTDPLIHRTLIEDALGIQEGKIRL